MRDPTQADAARPGRRGVLTFAAVTAYTALAGCAVGGPTPNPSAPAAAVTLSPDTVTTWDLITRHLPSGVSQLAMVIPTRRPPIGLVVVLHGAGHTGPQAFSELGLAEHVETTGWAIAAPSGENTWWHPRGRYGDGLALVVDDVIPTALLTAQLPADTPVALMGYSMGGYGALLVGATLGPRRCRGIVAQAPALFTDPRQASHAFDSAQQFDEWSITGKRIETLRQIPLWVDCGEQDYFIDVSRALAAELPQAKTTFRPGDHDTSVWRPLVGEQLTWLAGHSTG